MQLGRGDYQPEESKKDVLSEKNLLLKPGEGAGSLRGCEKTQLSQRAGLAGTLVAGAELRLSLRRLREAGWKGRRAVRHLTEIL